MSGKTFWKPRKGRYRWFYAEYHPVNDHDRWINKQFESGAEREVFIREQSELIRRCSTDEEYMNLYNSILTLTR